MTNPKRVTAVEKLRLSRLRPTQLELLGDDIDLKALYLALNHKDIRIEDAVLDVNVDRTIQGASTVTVTVEDRDRVLLRSGRLSARNDIEIDGLYFRLKGVVKTGSQLTLTFEDREIAVMRTYNKPIKQALSTSRQKVTRAEFVLRMVKEVKEFKIPYIIPELHKVQPIQAAQQLQDSNTRQQQRGGGVPKQNDLTVKGQPMTEEQRKNANAILDTGVSLLVPLRDEVVRKCLVMSMMCVIQESTLHNLTGGDRDSVGLFQQRGSQGWPASRDIPVDATAFFNALKTEVQLHPNEQYYAAIQAVQRSAFPTAYAQWRTEAERIVTTYGYTAGSVSDNNAQWTPEQTGNGDYEFYRGRPPTSKKANWGKESSWDCILRLANEVNWRAFFVSGTFYFISDDDLLKSQPIATIDEDTEGIESIDLLSYDEGTRSAEVEVVCRAGRWAAPPGSVIQLKNMGPANGRWLVNDVSRSLFDSEMTITLKKKLPRLPEPGGSNLANQDANTTWTGTDVPTDTPGRGTQFRTPGAFVQPIPRGYNSKIIQGVHETAGLAGYPAADFGADAGAPVVAVESGKIVKLSGHDPTLGPSDPLMGVHGPFGWSVYLLGDSGSEYYYTHLGTRIVVLGEHVSAGEKIGTVGNYAMWGGANHTHVGVAQGGRGPSIQDLMNSPQAVAVGKTS